MVRNGISGAARMLLASLAGLATGSLSAHAELRVCNQTLNLYNVAVGYFAGEHCQQSDPLFPAACRLQTEGWWNLPASGCITPLKQPLGQRYYYVFALDIYGSDALTGETPLCVNVTRRFTIDVPYDELTSPRCWQRGYQQVKFREIDVGKASDWTVFVNQGGGE